MVASESTSKRGSDWRTVSVGGKDRPARPTVKFRAMACYTGMLSGLGYLKLYRLERVQTLSVDFFHRDPLSQECLDVNHRQRGTLGLLKGVI
jgi:hypothetical protein